MATKKRHARSRTLSDTVRDNLEELRKERGLDYSGFAALIGVRRTVYNSWRNNGVVPGSDHLRRVADKLSVTTDWLLGVEGEPKLRNQRRTARELEEDVGAAALRALRERVPPKVRGSDERFEWFVSGEGILRVAIEGLLEPARDILAQRANLTDMINAAKALQRAAALVSEGALSVQTSGHSHSRLLTPTDRDAVEEAAQSLLFAERLLQRARDAIKAPRAPIYLLDKEDARRFKKLENAQRER